MKKVIRTCTTKDQAGSAKKAGFEAYYANIMTCQKLLQVHGKGLCQQETINETISYSDLEEHKEVVEFLYQYAQENLAHLKVFIKDPYYTLIKKDIEYSIASFIGTTGGLVGLCFGLSFISIIEVVLFCFKFVFKPISKCLNANSMK